MKYSLISLTLFIVVSGCSSQGQSASKIIKISEGDFGTPVHLKAEPVIRVSGHLNNPWFCDIVDSVLIVDENSNSPYFKFFSLNNFKYLGWYGKKGEGPGEIGFFPTMIHQSYGDVKSLSIQFYDFGKKRLAKLPLSRVLEDSSIEPKQYYMMPPKLVYAQRVSYLNDSTIVGGGGIRDGKLFFENLKTDSISYTPFIPKVKQKIDMRVIGNVYFGLFTINRQRHRIAWVSQYFKQLEIYDSSGNLLSVTSFQHTPAPVFYPRPGVMVSEKKTMYYYEDIASTNKYIFADYLGIPLGELNQLGEVKIESQIQVFDWNGKPVQKYIVNGFLSSFDIDLKHNRILGISPYNKKSPLVSFDLGKKLAKYTQ